LLFDGKSLEGWHKNSKKIGHGTGGLWRAEGGAITGEQDPPGSGNGGILLTDKKFADFKTLGKEGHIAVQIHGGNGWQKGAKCRWKNIRIRELA
jgi:hypothetical protein